MLPLSASVYKKHDGEFRWCLSPRLLLRKHLQISLIASQNAHPFLSVHADLSFDRKENLLMRSSFVLYKDAGKGQILRPDELSAFINARHTTGMDA